MSNRRSTIHDVAERAGVSIGTVSRVSAGGARVAPETRKSVEKAMSELGYVPDAAARTMRLKESKTVGFLVPDITNPIFSEVAKAAELRLAKEGYTLFIFSSDRSKQREVDIITQSSERRMDGLIVSLSDELDKAVLQALEKTKVPLILWDRDISLATDVVLNDHIEPLQTVTKHLISLGHRRIALIGVPTLTRPGRERVKGYKNALSEAGIAIDDSLIRCIEYSSDHGYRNTLELMDGLNPPTALIAAGNEIFFGMMKAIRKLNLRIPEELSIIGTDDRLISEIFDPPITTVDRDLELIGKTLADVLVQRLKGEGRTKPVKIMIPSRVILRSSTSVPSKDS